jgi:hypothetical protein
MLELKQVAGHGTPRSAKGAGSGALWRRCLSEASWHCYGSANGDGVPSGCFQEAFTCPTSGSIASFSDSSY